MKQAKHIAMNSKVLIKWFKTRPQSRGHDDMKQKKI